jgi:glutamate-1-semialdehyde aminotransferase
MLESGDGPYVTCPDGVTYLDTVAALGPILLGHNHPEVTLAVYQQADKLASSTLSTALEVEVAEMLCDIIPGAEMCRMATNGKDVTEAAIKVARYITGHRHVVYTGYHGGFGDYLITTDKCGGVLPTLAPYNHQIAFRDFVNTFHGIGDFGDDLAAIIVEVPPRAWDEPKEEVFDILAKYQDIAHDNGALFILDEVVTGFRYALGGAQEYYGITADLACFSKGMGNGYPVAAVTGAADIIRAFEGGKVFLSTTFGANPIGLAAARATIQTLQNARVYRDFVLRGTEAVETLAGMIQRYDIPVSLRGNHARFVLDFTAIEGVASFEQLRTLWMQEMGKEYVLAGVPYFPMVSWDANTLRHFFKASEQACVTVLDVVRGDMAIDDALEVPVITDVFSGRYGKSEEDARDQE